MPEPAATAAEPVCDEAPAWAGGDYDMASYATPMEALDAYAAFHAHSLSTGEARRRALVFVPNQYGLGNRLRAMKSALLIAMLTGRVFHVRWEEPVALHELVRPVKVDWREPDPPLPRADARSPPSAESHVLCLPFATAPAGGDCARGHQNLMHADLRAAYQRVATLEVHTFTDLFIFVHKNPTYEALLRRFAPACPNRMGCLYRYLFAPRERIQRGVRALDAPEWVGVQVRNRLWTQEQHQPPAAGEAKPRTLERVLECMDIWVPPRARVFFTADDDRLYPLARTRWGGRLLTHTGGVFMPWSRGTRVDASSLGEDDEAALVKAFVDWFALQSASRIVYTHQSSFGKTAAEATDAPSIDVNYTRCATAEAEGVGWDTLPPRGTAITYDTSRVPGAR
jgi:hypothetical protein